MSTRDELVAPKFADMEDGQLSYEAQQKLAKELGADSLRYLPVSSLARCVGLSPDRLCRACVTGHYPTETGQRLYSLDGSEPVLVNGVGGARAYER